jgi:predicted ArsR family transcriptional regulator
MADRRRITDPKALRALAHPLRWKLLEVVGREGTATATQCAQEIGESVASCSYHLNMLAKYDFVEQAEGGQGREKPWRLVYAGQEMSNVGVEGESALAMQAASGAFLDYALTQIRERQLSTHLESDEWRAVVGIDNSSDYLTPDEVSELREAFTERIGRFRERRTKPELRPEGARPVNFFLSATVAPTD